MKHRSMPHQPEAKSDACPIDWILVMADYGASGIWVRGGCVDNPTYYGVSEDLCARFKKWIRHYETLLDDTPFDWAAFSARGHELAVCLKRELPEVEIEYYDENINRNRAEGLPGIWERIQHNTPLTKRQR